jgi:hypothetical protein
MKVMLESQIHGVSAKWNIDADSVNIAIRWAIRISKSNIIDPSTEMPSSILVISIRRMSAEVAGMK